MPRIVVVDDRYDPLMDEFVTPDHLRDDYSATQLMERLTWAINDAHERVGTRRKRKRAVTRVQEARRIAERNGRAARSIN